MNRTDRLLAIVLELQGKGRQRAEDLASTFEVSKRTIYRDIEALSEAGVPVAAAPGVGYMLVEGYFLPPLSFTAEEAIMLLMGSDVMRASFDAQYRQSAVSAGRKIAGVLPDRLRLEVDYLQSSILFVVPDGGEEGRYSGTLQQVRRAIIERHTVSFSYHARYRHTPGDKTGIKEEGKGKSRRKADPYGIVHVGGSWYMVAHDHDRRDIRSFKLERMEGLTVREETFTRPASFRLGLRDTESRDTVVRALFDEEATRWVREAPSFFTVSEEQTEEGLLVTLHVRHEREVLGWFMGWGRHVRVLEPDTLRRLLREEATAIERLYGAE